MTSGGSPSQAVGSVTFIDGTISDTPIGVLTSHDSAISSYSNGSLILENVHFKNVRTAVQGPKNSTALAGTSGSKRVAAWGQGHQYTPTGPASFQGVIPEFIRPNRPTRRSRQRGVVRHDSLHSKLTSGRRTHSVEPRQRRREIGHVGRPYPNRRFRRVPFTKR